MTDMIMPTHRVRILVATQPVDFRKGHDGLAALVQSALKEDPFTGTVFVFRAKRADRLKILFWDGTGLVMAYKRLEETTPGAVRGALRRPGLAPGEGAGSAPAGCGRVTRATE
jgi:hypothetical protein